MRKNGRVGWQRGPRSALNLRVRTVRGSLVFARTVGVLGAFAPHRGLAADLEEAATDLGEVESRPGVPLASEVRGAPSESAFSCGAITSRDGASGATFRCAVGCIRLARMK
jgi:hypothetical protein